MRERADWGDPRSWTQDEAFHREVEQAVARAEEQTSAELVVVVAGSSGNYRDADQRCGAGLALAALAVMFWTPYHVHELVALIGVVVCFLGGSAASARWPWLRRCLTREGRRREQAREEARLAFHEEAVRATLDRTGVLLFVSVFEREVEILPDLAIEGRLPGGVLRAIEAAVEGAPQPRAAFLEAIGQLAAQLHEPFPRRDEDRDEIPNAPRVR